jgi:hypothetical protein
MIKVLSNPFSNDPFALVWTAFKNLYPEKDCECWFDAVDDPKDVDGHYGWTEWNDDGTITIAVDIGLALKDAVEIFAHELAHVAAGSDAEHGEAWENAFDAIHAEYNRIGNDLFDKHTATKCINAKALKPIS